MADSGEGLWRWKTRRYSQFRLSSRLILFAEKHEKTNIVVTSQPLPKFVLARDKIWRKNLGRLNNTAVRTFATRDEPTLIRRHMKSAQFLDRVQLIVYLVRTFRIRRNRRKVTADRPNHAIVDDPRCDGEYVHYIYEQNMKLFGTTVVIRTRWIVKCITNISIAEKTLICADNRGTRRTYRYKYNE